MAIDVTVPRSPGWWMQRLYRKLNAEQKRLKLLEDYYTGRPPLPWGSENQKARFYRFQQTSRSNFAALIVQAPCERCGVRSISTATDQSENGDQTAWELFTANDLDIHFGDVSRSAFKFGAAYMAVGMPDPDEGTGQAVITSEDPRQVTVAFDPMRPRKVVAAFKLFHDDQATYFDDGHREHVSVADALGAKRLVIMKNHGGIIASQSIESATIEAVVAEQAARYHLECEAIGGTPILEDEVVGGRAMYFKHFIPNMWESNIARLRLSDPDLFE